MSRRPLSRPVRRAGGLAHGAGLGAGLGAALALLTACGDGLQARVTRAMDGCVLARNPAFVAGRGATALDTPLPPAADSAAADVAHAFAFDALREIATDAPTQAVLVCALEVGARYQSAGTTRWLRQYTRHPDAAVAIAARRLLGEPATDGTASGAPTAP